METINTFQKDFKPYTDLAGALCAKNNGNFVNKNGEHCQISQFYIGNKLNIYVYFVQPKTEKISRRAIRTSSERKVLKLLNSENFKRI